MSGHGCSVDTALPEGFLRERLLETRGELYHHHRNTNDQRASSSPKLITGQFMHHIPNMSPPTFGSLIDLYRTDQVDGLLSSLRISSSTSTVNTSCSSNSSTSFFSASTNTSCDSIQDIWSSSPTPTDREESKKRSSSLKSSRTNGTNSTNGEKKIVRFADVLGLDLADVHTFLDEIPRIPKSAFKDLKNVDLRPCSPPVNSFKKDPRQLVPLFSQPAAQGWFTERLAKNKVCLENTFVTNLVCLNVRGTIRVVNVHFEKQVTVRYTLDKWNTFTEVPCTYVDGSSDGFSDRFGFSIPVTNMQIGQRIEFAINYTVSGEEFWDNNDGANYCLQCIPEGPPKPVTTAYVSTSSSLAIESWGSFY